MLLCKRDLISHLSYDIYVSLRNHPRQRCCDDIFPDTVQGSSVNESGQYFRISGTLLYLLNDLVIALAVGS